MKRIAIIVALLTYLTLNLGISMNIHYCGDTIRFIDFFPIEKKSCCSIKTKTCCNDKLAVIQNNTVQDGVSTFQYTIQKSYTAIIPTVYFSVTETVNPLAVTNNFTPARFLVKSTPPLYILNQVFRI